MKIKSVKHGKNILKIEVTNISQHGLWVWIKNKEYFLPYTKFPWFKNATVSEIHNVKMLNENRLYWEDLDIDLSIKILEDPDKYILVSA